MISIPLVFCGVNVDPATYAYPRENVAGVRETLFSEETVKMIINLFPGTAHVHFIGDRSETTIGMQEQLEASVFDGVVVDTYAAGSFSQWKDIVRFVSNDGAAIVILANRTLKDEHGNTIDSSSVTK